MEYDLYTAVAIQPEIHIVKTRDDIRKNLQRCLELIDAAPQTALAARGNYGDSWAPIKLISFPEFFLQGHEGHWSYEFYLQQVLIEIPGPETEALAQKAREYDVYIAGCALERDPEWIRDGYFFNTHFIISPQGEVIHKYRKFHEASHYGLAVSPHDIYDKWVERYGDDLASFFPVADTEIGKIGTITCMDGHFPEIARALGVQGAEVILHPTMPDPMVSFPYETWQMMNRMRAWENIAYVVAANWGAVLGANRQKSIAPGRSMIVDYAGTVRAYADFPGEAIISAVINLEELRRRRLDPSRNFPTLMRNEVFRKIYEQPVYKANQFLKAPPRTRQERDPLETIREFVRRGIYKAPKHVPDGFHL